MITLQQKLKDSIACLNKNKYAIAVSGGSDSLALLYLCAEFSDKEFVVVHFDHNVRKESADEANFVELTAKQLGFKFFKHIWQNKPNQTKQPNQTCSGNFYQAARKARYQFFAKICNEYKLDGVLVAHSKTDLAETLLMRLGKGTSLKGASIFSQGVNIFGVNVYRPLLEFNRQDLQDYLTEKNIRWKNDPSNLDQNKMRPRIRAILPKLEEIGISLTGFSKSTEYFNNANQTLDYYKKNELKNFIIEEELKYSYCDSSYFFNLPTEMQIRLVNYFIASFNQNIEHFPRRKKIEKLLKRLSQSKIEPLDNIYIELVENNLFFYSQAFELTENSLGNLDKKTRYNLIKKHNLQFLPIRIRNRMPKSSANLNI